MTTLGNGLSLNTSAPLLAIFLSVRKKEFKYHFHIFVYYNNYYYFLTVMQAGVCLPYLSNEYQKFIIDQGVIRSYRCSDAQCSSLLFIITVNHY